MTDIFYFDAAAELVVILLIFSMFIRKVYKTPSSKIFIVILICCFLAAMFEIPTCFPQTIGYNLLWFFNTGYFIARNTMPVAFVLYIVAITDSYEFIRRKKVLLFALILPYALSMALIVTNNWHKSVFFITESLVYTRGSLLFILYLCSAFYLVYAAAYLIICRKLFSRYQFVSLFSVIPLTVTAVIIQFFNQGSLVELFVSTLSFIMICSAIETPSEQIDNKTGLLSLRKFINNTNRSFLLKKAQYTLLLKVENFSEVYNLLDYDSAKKYVKHMSSIFDKRYRYICPKYISFYLEEGMYAAVYPSYEMALRIANMIVVDFDSLTTTKFDFRPKLNICVTNIVEDFDDFSAFNSFLNNLQNRFKFEEKIVEVCKIKNEKGFIIENNIENIIDDGLKNNEFEVYYQPIYSVKTLKFESAEALIRLNSSKFGFIMPELFIKHAEKDGRIIQIDNFVLEEVMKFISSPDFARLGLKYIEVNLSIVDCMDPTLHERIKVLLEKYNVNPEYINLEFTESVDADHDVIDINISKLKEMGIHFSLDDYGTGYSNIDRFTKLPLKIVKIDKSLVDRYDDKVVNNVLKNTINMIKDLDRKVVVEGTENEKQVEKLKNLGCDYIQGFYYSKPLSLNKFIEFLAKHNHAEMVD